MTRRDDNPRPAVTPRQLALIGVLAAALAGVLLVQFDGQPESEPGDREQTAGEAGLTPAAQGPAQPATARDDRSKPAAGEPARRPSWPRLSLSEAAAHDPFAMPEAFAQTASASQKKETAGGNRQEPSRRKAEQERALAALRSAGASAVFHSPRGSVAIVGRNMVRVGDELNGFRVVSIDQDGVLLAPLNPQDGQEDQP